ncbi:MAG: hypothetical protein ABIO60_03045 [Aquaticitalea sp.]
MEAIRQIVKVKNHSITVSLPDDFDANEVEVIIFPTNQNNYVITKWQIDKVRERTDNYLKNPKSVTNIDDFLKELDSEL